MKDKIYPEKRKEISGEEVNEKQLGEDMIALFESEAPEGYFPGNREGEALSKTHIIGIAMRGRDIIGIAEKVYHEILEDSKRMRNLSPSDFEDVNEFKSELKSVSKHIDETKFYNKLKEAEGVNSFGDLKLKKEAEIKRAHEGIKK